MSLSGARRRSRGSICGTASAGARRHEPRRCRSRAGRWLSRRRPAGAARLRDLRAARQPVPVGVRREVVLPATSCRRSSASRFWGRVFAPRGNALASLGTSVWIALLTVVVSLAVAHPRRLCAGAAQAAAGAALILLAFLLPQAVPEPAGLREHRARVLRDRPQRHDPGRRARACVARPGARGVDRVGRVRVGRRLARGGRAQHRRVAAGRASAP